MTLSAQQFNSRIRLRHIQCFVAVAQEQHLRKAAERLHLSQPAVSKTLAELEELVGVRLMDRGRFGARLTRDGQAFLSHAMAVLEALDSGRRAVGDESEAAFESVSVGALPTVAPDLLPHVLAQFRTEWPRARIDVQIGSNAQLLDKLRSGEVDLVLGRMADPEAMAGLSFELLYVEPLVAVVSPNHPLCQEFEVSLPALVEFPLIVSTPGTVPRHNTEAFLRSRGLDLPSNCLETLSVPISRHMVMNSDAVWFCPRGAAREDLVQNMLLELPIKTEGTEEPVGLLHRSEITPIIAVQALMKLMRASAVKRRGEGRGWTLS